MTDLDDKRELVDVLNQLDRVRRRGNELFDVYGWGQDHITKRAYLRFQLKAQA